MKNSGKILRGGFWVLLIASICLGYFKITETSEVDHYKYIPSGVDGVVVFDARKISKKFVDRFRYNPGGLEDLMPNKLSSGEGEFQNLGIDPFYKMVMFHFSLDNHNYGAFLMKCDSRTFLKFLDELPDIEFQGEDNVSNGIVTRNFELPVQKGTVCVGNGVGICCFSLDGNPIGNKEQDELNSFLTEGMIAPDQGLLASDSNFQDFSKVNEDVAYWSNGKTIGFGGMSNDFVDSRTYCSFEQGEVVIDAELDFLESCPLKPDVKALNSSAPFALSFMVEEQHSSKFVNEIVPKAFRKFLDGYNGNFFLEISGHQLYQGYHVADSIDEETFETYEVLVKNEMLTPFPKFTTVFGVNDIARYEENLKLDTAYQMKDEYYEFELLQGVPCCINVMKNNVCISNDQSQLKHIQNTPPEEIYATYSILLDFVALKESFPLKGDLGIGVPNVLVHTGFDMLNFEKLYVDVVEVTESKVKGHGAFKFKDADRHSIEAILEMVELGISNRGIIEGMLFQSER